MPRAGLSSISCLSDSSIMTRCHYSLFKSVGGGLPIPQPRLRDLLLLCVWVPDCESVYVWMCMRRPEDNLRYCSLGTDHSFPPPLLPLSPYPPHPPFFFRHKVSPLVTGQSLARSSLVRPGWSASKPYGALSP